MDNLEVERQLREAGYEPKLVGKYYQLVADHVFLKIEVERLREALGGLLDGLDANSDLRCGLSDEQWKRRIKTARRVLPVRSINVDAVRRISFEEE